MCGGSALDALKFAWPVAGFSIGYVQSKKKSEKRKRQEKEAAVAKETARLKSVARAKAKDRAATKTVYSADQSQNIIGGDGFGQ